MKCKECGGEIIKAPTYSKEREYEYVCSRCGLVYSEPFSISEEEFAEAEIQQTKTLLFPLNNAAKKLKKIENSFCKVCGEVLQYKGMGRRPKYCKKCAQLTIRMQKLNYEERRRKKIKLSEKDIFLRAIQKRAS